MLIGLFKGIFAFIRGVLKVASALLGIAIGLLFMGWLFLDDLPLGEPAPEVRQASGSYLDMHVHTAGIGAGDSGCFVSQDLLDSYKYYFYLHAFGVTREELASEGDQLVVSRISKLIAESEYVKQAVVLAMDGVIDDSGELDQGKTEIFVPNDFVATETAKYENLLFGASVNPYRPDAIRRLVRAKRQGAVLLKWIPSIMNIDPADKALTSFYLALKELDLPLLTHTGQEASFTYSIDEYNDPKRLKLPLELGVRVIAAHIATTGEIEGEEQYNRVLPLLRKYENLHADISSLTQINKLGYLKRTLEMGAFNSKLMYGSDWPLQFFPLVSPWFHLRHLSPATMRYIGKVENAWDRDILIKKALGVPEEVFLASEKFLLGREDFPDLFPGVEEESENVEKGAKSATLRSSE